MSATGEPATSRQGGVFWAVAVGALGTVVSGAIIYYSEPQDRWSGGLGTAAQVFVASIVAAFGVLQIFLARDQISVARASVEASNRSVVASNAAVSKTQEQNEIMVKQLEDAREEASQRTDEAKKSLTIANETLTVQRHQAWDSDAPNVSLTCDSATFQECDIQRNPLPVATERKIWDSIEATSKLYKYSARFTLRNLDSRVIEWSRSGEPNTSAANGGLMGALQPGERTEFAFEITWTVEQHYHSAKSLADAGNPYYHRIELSTATPVRTVVDLHRVACYPPYIGRDGSRYVVEPWPVQFQPVSIVERQYVAEVAGEETRQSFEAATT